MMLIIIIGEYLKEGKAGISFNYVTTPQRVTTFVQKDNKGKMIREYKTASGNISGNVGKSDTVIKIRVVGAGRNHCVCIEDWEQSSCNSSGDGAGDEMSYYHNNHGDLVVMVVLVMVVLMTSSDPEKYYLLQRLLL